MSDNTNRKIVERAYAAFLTGDIESLLTLFSDDVSWNIPTIEHVRISGSRTGKPSLAKFFSELAQDQDVVQFEPRQLVAEGDLVVALGHYRWRIKATGREVTSDFGHVFTITNGRIVRFQEFMDTAAFTAAYSSALTTV